MKPFHVYLYGPEQGPIETSFEAAAERLETIERLHFEPDGSFRWISHGRKEQIYGMLYDAAGHIQYVEIQGQCQHAAWRRFVLAIAGPTRDRLFVMCLPGRQLQDLQTFETANWP